MTNEWNKWLMKGWCILCIHHSCFVLVLFLFQRLMLLFFMSILSLACFIFQWFFVTCFLLVHVSFKLRSISSCGQFLAVVNFRLWSIIGCGQCCHRYLLLVLSQSSTSGKEKDHVIVAGLILRFDFSKNRPVASQTRHGACSGPLSCWWKLFHSPVERIKDTYRKIFLPTHQ